MRNQFLAITAALSIGLMNFNAAAQTPPVEGSVVKIDEAAGKITLDTFILGRLGTGKHAH